MITVFSNYYTAKLEFCKEKISDFETSEFFQHRDTNINFCSSKDKSQIQTIEAQINYIKASVNMELNKFENNHSMDIIK